MKRYVIKTICKYDQDCKKIHKYLRLGISYKSTFHNKTCVDKFLGNQLGKDNLPKSAHSFKGKVGKINQLDIVDLSIGRGIYNSFCSIYNELSIYKVGKAKRENLHNCNCTKSGKEKDRKFADESRQKNILSLSRYTINVNFASKMRKIKFRSFTQIAEQLKKETCMKFAKLNLNELLVFINKNLSKDIDIRTWNHLFIQIDKVISKKTKNEEYKIAINTFFENLSNIDYYILLKNLRDVDENTKINILNSLFFDCFVLSLRHRDITYACGKNRRTGESEEIYSEGYHERGEIDSPSQEKKSESKVKSYMKNLKSFLSITSNRRNSRGTKNLEVGAQNDRTFPILGANVGDSADVEVRGDSANVEVRGDSANVEVRGDSANVEVRGDSADVEVRGDSANVEVRGEAKNVKMIRKWFNLLSHFSNTSENILILKDYLNKIFRKNIDELIHLCYFSKTVHYLTNQINSKSIHAIIYTYETKLHLMNPYDFSFSLIILLRFLILNHSMFINIINYGIQNPLKKFENEKCFIRFIKSVDNYPLIYPAGMNFCNSVRRSGSGTGGSGSGGSGSCGTGASNGSGSGNGGNVEFVQENMNSFCNFTFTILIRKMSLKLKYYSLPNLLFISECLGKVIFMPNTQNQTLHVFINKLRYHINNLVNFSSVDNYTLIRLFKISSFFSFVPELETFVNSSPKCVKMNRKYFTSNLGDMKCSLDKSNFKSCESGDTTGKDSINRRYANSEDSLYMVEYKKDTANEVISPSCTAMEEILSPQGEHEQEGENQLKNSNTTSIQETSLGGTATVARTTKEVSDKTSKPGGGSIMRESTSSGNKKILKSKNDEGKDEKSKKKSLCFNLSDKKVINYYYEKWEENDNNINSDNFLTNYDLYVAEDNTFKMNSYLLNYNVSHDMNKKHKKNNFLLKNIVMLLCSQIDKNLEEIRKELKRGKKDNKKTHFLSTFGDMNKHKLVEEIKTLNEKHQSSKNRMDNVEMNYLQRSTKKNELYDCYLIFYDTSVLSDIVKFTHFSINANKHTYELVKSIKKRLEEIVQFYLLKGEGNGNSDLQNGEHKSDEKKTSKGKKSHGEKGIHDRKGTYDAHVEYAKIKNITTFQLYHFYCACKNLSPSFLFRFFDVLLKLTPKINIIDLEKSSDLFGKKTIHKMENLEMFEKVRNEKITIPFIVSLLHSLKIIISSNLYLTNNLLNEHISTMVQYSYYVLLYYYSNKYKKKHSRNVTTNLGNNAEQFGHKKKEEENSLETSSPCPAVGRTPEALQQTTSRSDNANYTTHGNSTLDGNRAGWNRASGEEKQECFPVSGLSSHSGHSKHSAHPGRSWESLRESDSEVGFKTGDDGNIGEKSFYEQSYRSQHYGKNIFTDLTRKDDTMSKDTTMNDEKEGMEKSRQSDYQIWNYSINPIFEEEGKNNSDCSAISSIIKSNKKSKKLCIFEDLYLEDMCNVYVCLSTSLFFLNRTEEKSNEIKHLIYLENKFLKLVSKVKYMKYLSDNLIFFLFKSPTTYKLEQILDSIIPSIKIINKTKRKTSEIISSLTHSQNYKVLSLPAATAFFLCKIKLSIASSGSKETNIVRIENLKKLFDILINDYKLLTNCIEKLFLKKKKNDNDKDNFHDNSTFGGDDNLVHLSHNEQGRKINLQIKNTEIGSGKFSRFRKKRKKFSYLPFLISNKSCMDQNVYLKSLIGDMFFGVHEAKTLYDLQNTLLKTVKHLETSQININVNYKIVQIQPIHNDVLFYLSELSKVVKECLYTIFLSQPYIHKSSEKYTTKSLVNYFINKCKFVRDYNIFDDLNNKSFNELRSNKYMTNKFYA
ncbi:conserved Plasmodium protein, unknown function [Plasmodium ovale]|nr:conserved Plasmodium protein, unknown function [Plasmodium ovale]